VADALMADACAAPVTVGGRDNADAVMVLLMVRVTYNATVLTRAAAPIAIERTMAAPLNPGTINVAFAVALLIEITSAATIIGSFN
jgi:hypothetical protein